jgi:hypothetical protein
MALFGMGILLMTPKVVDMVKEAIQAPEFKYSSAIGEAVGVGWKGAQWAPSRGLGIGREMRAESMGQEQRIIEEGIARGETYDIAASRAQIIRQRRTGKQRAAEFFSRFTGLRK